jgi:hypothetical protein
MMTCHTFARQLQPENSSVWKERFLQKYDYPIIKGPYEFRIAYQLRAIALPRFGDLGFETRNNAKVLLKILKDMVLETYNKPDSRYPNPQISPNILAFSDAMKSEWMVHFLATRLFARDHQHPYGRLPNNKLFDVLQVAFSYLVLNRSTMAFQVGSDKTDYDLARVYNWQLPFSMLFQYLPDINLNDPLVSSSGESPPVKMHFKLDINTLVHIRNFWHRHLTEAKAMGGEETFANMAADLAKVGISPKAWTQPLQQPSKLQNRWYGHYSCIYPWPKSRRQLEEKESEAEVWDTVDPLVGLSSTKSWNITNSVVPQFQPPPQLRRSMATHLLTHSCLCRNPSQRIREKRRLLHPRPRHFQSTPPLQDSATHALHSTQPPVHPHAPTWLYSPYQTSIRHPRLATCRLRSVQTHVPLSQ